MVWAIAFISVYGTGCRELKVFSCVVKESRPPHKASEHDVSESMCDDDRSAEAGVIRGAHSLFDPDIRKELVAY